MTKTTTLFNSKTVSSLLGCLVVLCTLVNTHANAAPYDSGIEVKTSQFDSFLDDVSDDIGTDNNDNQLAEKIRQQRAAFNAQSAKTDVATKTKSAMSSGKNECDQKLRACIKSKCGDDFSKCAGDTDTSWGNKMDLCRMDTTCTGEEYALFTKEIKADRDMNARLASYTSIVNCGNEYNNCIITECGKTFTNCLGKTAGDKAVQKCSKIANKCKEQDSGLSSRMMEAFGNLRGNAEKAIARDEQRLYDLRDAMRETCDRLGAMFDERSLDCVYTVNFYAGEDGDLYASRKAYAGSTFNCTQEWFGVDLTTFMENAFRLTRAQSSASSAALGAGVGMAAGAITSGAIGRAVDRAKAERALGEELCTSTGGTWQKAINKCKCKDTQSFNEETGCADDQKKIDKANKKAKNEAERNQKKEDKEKLKKLCEQNGTWIAGNCKCKDKTHSFDEEKGCHSPSQPEQQQPEQQEREVNQSNSNDLAATPEENHTDCWKEVDNATAGQWRGNYCHISECKQGYYADVRKCKKLMTERECQHTKPYSLRVIVYEHNNECTVSNCVQGYTIRDNECVLEADYATNTTDNYCQTALGANSLNDICICGGKFITKAQVEEGAKCFNGRLTTDKLTF